LFTAYSCFRNRVISFRHNTVLKSPSCNERIFS
jgi:hypothetical protein